MVNLARLGYTNRVEEPLDNRWLFDRNPHWIWYFFDFGWRRNRNCYREGNVVNLWGRLNWHRKWNLLDNWWRLHWYHNWMYFRRSRNRYWNTLYFWWSWYRHWYRNVLYIWWSRYWHWYRHMIDRKTMDSRHWSWNRHFWIGRDRSIQQHIRVLI